MSGIKNILTTLKGDRVIWAILILLSLLSILVVYSSTGKLAFMKKGGNTEYFLIKHTAILVFGLMLAYLSYSLNYQVYKKMAPYLIVIAVPLLILTMAMGVDVNQARRWLQVPGVGLTFQTSDFAKLALVIYLANAISEGQEKIKELKNGFFPVLIPVLLICGLIAPADLSTAIILFLTALGMMFVGRIHIKYLISLVSGGIILFTTLVTIGKFFPNHIRVDTWVERVRAFALGSGDNYQIMQAKMAIANGGITGVGPGNSIQQNFLPSSYSDFIYAIISEEYGLVGAGVVLMLYVILMFRITRLVTKSPKAFGSMLATGLGLLIIIQAMANMAVSVNLLPVTGLPLPMMSMGGSSVLFSAIAFGMILSVSKYIEALANKNTDT